MNRAFLMGCVAAFGAAAGWAFAHWLGWWGLLISVPLGLMVGNAVGRGRVMTAVVEVDDRPRTWSLPPEPGPEVTAVRCACCRARWERAGLLAVLPRREHGRSWDIVGVEGA